LTYIYAHFVSWFQEESLNFKNYECTEEPSQNPIIDNREVGDVSDLARQMVDRFAKMNCGSINDMSHRRKSGSGSVGRRSLEDIVRHKAADG
jgi:hypothetical protein